MSHEITVSDRRAVEQAMDFTGEALTEGDILRTNTLPTAERTFNCTCGTGGMDYQEAVEHMQSVNSRVSPETIEEVARKRLRGDPIATGERDNGFIYTTARRGWDAIVGLHMDGDEYVVALIKKKRETIGRGDPKIKTSENEYVEVGLYRMAYKTIPTGEPQEIAKDVEDRGDSIDTGYINGYRLTALSKVLSDTFKWYAN